MATFTTSGSQVKVASNVQVSGVTENDFTAPVVYEVVAADSGTKSYTVTVTRAAAPKDLTSFTFTAALNGGAGISADCAGVIAGNKRPCGGAWRSVSDILGGDLYDNRVPGQGREHRSSQRRHCE